jgi:hypothetical protein
MSEGWGELRKLTRDEARMEQHLYWSRKSVPERLAAATELIRGIDLDERKADFTPSRVPRQDKRKTPPQSQ